MSRRFQFALCCLVTAVVFVVAAAVQADGYCNRRTTYAAPTYAPHHAPHYAPHYATPTYNGYQHYDYYPVPVPYHAQQDYFYSVQDYYRDALLADAIEGRIRRIVDQQRKPDGPPGQVAPPAPPAPPPPVPPRPTPAPASSVRTKVDPALLTSIEANGCVKCHSAGNPKSGGLVLTEQTLATMPEGQRWKMHGMVSSGEMPMGGKAVPIEQLKVYYEHAKLVQ